MNTNPSLRSQEEGIEYILRILDGMGSYRDYIRGIHLHYSLSGEYVLQAQRERRRSIPCRRPLSM